MYTCTDVNKALRITGLYTAFKAKFDDDYVFGGEFHDFWEIVIVLDGEIGITAGSDAFTLTKGQAVLHEPMEFHRLRSVGGSSPTAIILTFSAENMPEYTSKIFEIRDLKEPENLLKGLQENFDFYETSFITGIKEKNESNYQLVIKSLESFLIRAISHQTKLKKTSKSRTEKHYSTIIKVMMDNLDKNLSVAELARLCNMSEVNLKKTFSHYAGMGVMAYFNNLKITSAIPMIQGGMTVQEVASSLGFANQNYFSTVFKRIDGHSPSYYK